MSATMKAGRVKLSGRRKEELPMREGRGARPKTREQSRHEAADDNAIALLRKRAEELLRKRVGKPKGEALSREEMGLLIHELSTHQIELEIQNEELRRAQLSREKAEKRYADLYDFAPVGYFTLDRRGLILAANLTGASMLGTERRTAIGSPMMIYVSRNNIGTLSDHIRTVVASGKHQTCELDIMRRDGVTFFAHLSSVPSDENSVLTVITDISERRKAEEDILKLNQEMAAKNLELASVNKELASIIYSMAHDLRSPLRSAAEFARLASVQCESRADEREKDYLNRVRSAAEKANRLVEELLAFSQVSRQVLTPSKVNLSKIASDVSKGLRRTDPSRRVTFDIKRGLSALADAELVNVVIAHLLENAWKFTSKKENPRIEFGAFQGVVPDSRGKAGGAVESGLKRTIYYVRDNGVGFDAAYSDKLFAPFQRLHVSDEFEGTGIGLAIVERIIRRHGGRIWAEGAVRKGATVFFTLD